MPRRPAKQPGNLGSSKLWAACARVIMLTLAGALPMYLVSHILLTIGGDALWLPEGWRRPAVVLGLLLGTSVFHCIRAKGSKAESSQGCGHQSAAHRHEHQRRGRNSLICVGVALVLLVGYMYVQAIGIYSWPQAADWVADNYRMAGQSPPALPSALGKTSNTAEHDEVQSNERHGKEHGAFTIEQLPTFIDSERSRILIPPDPLRPKDLSHYLARIERDPLNAGQGDPLIQVLDREPDRIIDWLRTSEGQRGLHIYSGLLVGLYVLIIVATGTAVGFSFQTGSALGEWVASITAHH